MSGVEHSRPQWALFDRMEYADGLYNQPERFDFSEQQQAYKLSMLHVLEIKEAEFSEDTLLQAIASLSKTGGEIRLPAGRVELQNTLQLTSGIRLTGVLGRTELLFKQCVYGIAIRGHENEWVKQVELSNLRIFHEGKHQFCAAVFATYTQQLRMENIDIIAPRTVGFLLSDKVYKTQLISCHVKYAGVTGFMLIRDVIDTLLLRCSAEYCHQSGIFLTDLKLPIGIDTEDFDTQIQYTSRIIGNFAPFSAQDLSPYRTDIVDCVFRNNRKMGVATDGVGYLSVKNSIIAYNDGEGITIDNGSWGCLIQNCHIYNNGWRGMQEDSELVIDFVHEMGLMADNSSKAKLPGISLDNAAYIRIEHNHIECNWGDGVKLVRAAYACVIADNLIENNNRGVNDRFHYFGILIGVAEKQHEQQADFPSCYNQVNDNIILGQHFSGIHLMAHVIGNSLKNNHIDGAVFEAIEDHALSNILGDTNA